MEQRHYKAIFFDLDGTLLPMDMDEFLQRYFKLLNEHAARIGLQPERFSHSLGEGVKAMAQDATDRSNEEVFWTTFHQLYGDNAEEADASILEFYRAVFPHIGDGFQPNPAARKAVETLKAKGYPLYLVTMPMFPRIAVDARLKWADVDPMVFERITTYDNSFACKPDLRYYRQNLAIAGCAPEEVLMVGNNTREDLAAMELGCDAYLVTDWLLDPIGYPIETVKHGSLADFAEFAETLPVASGTPDSGKGE